MDVERRLVVAGVELVAEAGGDGVSLREIARRAGVSHGAPRRYFPTRQALLGAIALEGYRELEKIVDGALGGDEPRSALMALGRGYLDFARREPGMYALMFRHDLLTGNGIGLREASTPLFGVLVRVLEKAGKEEAAETAAALWAALHGIAQLWQWGSMQVVTGADVPEKILAAAIDAHLGR